MHGNVLAAGCQMLESYKWETFGEKRIKEPAFNQAEVHGTVRILYGGRENE